jgi:hypothetical protein
VSGNSVRIHASTKDDASRGLDNIRDKFDRLQKQGVKGFGIGVGAAVAVKGLSMLDSALSSSVQFIGDSISKAADLNETLAKSSVVFGDQADEIEAWGDTAAKSFGLSKNAAVAAAAGFGDLFNKMDETRDRSTDMSTSLVQLSSDLASFHNLAGGSAEALEKLRSGLAGETEPLRSIGVFLNEAKVQAKAAALGFQEVNGKFTEGAKIAARYSLIMEETASAQGDFERTSDSLVNQQRIANAALDDAQALLGEKLVPVMTLATEKGIQLIDAVVGIAGAFEQLADKVPGGSSAVDGFLQTVDPSKWLDINARAENFLDIIDDIGVDTDEARRIYRDFGLTVEEGSGKAEESVLSAADAFAEGKRKSILLRDGAVEVGDALEVVGDKADHSAKLVGRSLDDIIKDFEDAEATLRGLADDAADAIYDPIIAKGELAVTEREISEQKQIIASKNSTKTQVRDAKLRLAELNKKRMQLIGELTAYGSRTKKEITGDLKDLAKAYRTHTGKAKAEIFALILALSQLQAAQARTRIGSGRASRSGPLEREFRAGGGPVMANKAYIVGEEGPELLIPKSGGVIVPNAQPRPTTGGDAGGWTGGGGMTLNVTVNAAPGMTPGAAREIGEAFGPAVYEWMKRNRRAA